MKNYQKSQKTKPVQKKTITIYQQFINKLLTNYQQLEID